MQETHIKFLNNHDSITSENVFVWRVINDMQTIYSDTVIKYNDNDEFLKFLDLILSVRNHLYIFEKGGYYTKPSATLNVRRGRQYQELKNTQTNFISRR
jgi:hypothetical protein